MSTPSPGNPYAPPVARVADVADPGITVEVASRGQRLAAFLVDLATGIVLYLPPLLVAVLHWNSGEAWYLNFINAGLAVTGLLAVVVLVITIVFVARYGQTIGKRVVGIRVARPDGSKASLGRIFWLRNVVNSVLQTVVAAILGGILGVMHMVGGLALVAGYIYPVVDCLMIFGDSHQCLHDRIANTIVVKA